MENELITVSGSKVGMLDVIESVENAIIEGAIDNEKIVKEYAMVKAIEDRLATFKERTRSTILAAYEQVYGDKASDASFASFKISSTPVKYDFSKSADWEAADKNVKLATAERKNIEKQLIILGEVEKVSGGERYVQVTLKKNNQ